MITMMGITRSYLKIKCTWAGVKSNEGRASLSLLWAQTQERPLPSHAADPATTSAVTAQSHCHVKMKCYSETTT